MAVRTKTMNTSKELPRGRGALIVIKKYSGKPLETSVATFNLDSFGKMWVEVNSAAPRTFVGSLIDEWSLASVSAIENETDCVSDAESRVAFLIERFSDDAFYCLRPPLMGIEYVLVSRSAGKRYVLASDYMFYVTNDRHPLLSGEFESDEDALKALGYQAGPTK